MSRARQHAALLEQAQKQENESQRLAAEGHHRAARWHSIRAATLRRKAAKLFDENFSVKGKHSLDIQK